MLYRIMQQGPKGNFVRHNFAHQTTLQVAMDGLRERQGHAADAGWLTENKLVLQQSEAGIKWEDITESSVPY